MIGLPLSPARLEFVALPGASHETSSSVMARRSAASARRHREGVAARRRGGRRRRVRRHAHGDGPTSFTAATRVVDPPRGPQYATAPASWSTFSAAAAAVTFTRCRFVRS